LFFEFRHRFLEDVPDKLVINVEIFMDKPIAQSCNFLPWDIRILIFELRRQLHNGFPNDLDAHASIQVPAPGETLTPAEILCDHFAGDDSTMRTTSPTTRPTHSLFKFRAQPLNVLPSGFRLLDGDNPADPFIARQGCNILPFCSRRWIRNKSLS
jgi:hypothetical protein